MIEYELNSDSKQLDSIYKELLEYEKDFYKTKIGFNILCLANKIKKEKSLENLAELSFSLEREDNYYYLSIYPYDEEGEEIDDIYIQENSILNNSDYEYINNNLNLFNFNFSIKIKQNSNVILELAKGIMGSVNGELWFQKKQNKELFKELKEVIPENKVVKKSKI